MKSVSYDICLDTRHLKLVFNFLLSMLSTAAESSPNISSTKPGSEQDEEIENFDRNVFVEVVEDIDMDDVPTPIIYHDETEEDEWSDVIPEEE